MNRSCSYRWVVLAVGTLAYATVTLPAGIHRHPEVHPGRFDLDRGALGLLGAALFYAYALFQMPWGVAADRFGGRVVTAFGILLIALTVVGFATSQSQEALLFWRAAAGIAGAVA